MKLVIKPHHPVRTAAITIASMLALVFTIALAMDYGHWKSIAAAMVSTGNKRSLLEEATSLGLENEQLLDRLAQAKRGAMINGQARKDNHAEMVRLQSEVSALRAEVSFYRDILAGTEVGDGPRVKGIRIKRLAGTGRYSYKLVLTHVSEDDHVADGAIAVAIIGDSRGKRSTFAFADVVESGPRALTFAFKHFHLFEGTFKTPAEFIPRQIQVDVTLGPRKKRVHRQIYDWAAVLD